MREYALSFTDPTKPGTARTRIEVTSATARVVFDWQDQERRPWPELSDFPTWQAMLPAIAPLLGGFSFIYSEHGRSACLSADWGPRNAEDVGNLGGRDISDGDPAEVREFRDRIVKWPVEDVGGDPSWDEVGDAASRIRAELSDRKAA